MCSASMTAVVLAETQMLPTIEMLQRQLAEQSRRLELLENTPGAVPSLHPYMEEVQTLSTRVGTLVSARSRFLGNR